MNLVLLEMPDEHGALCAWLERRLLGVNLRDLVEQLQLVLGRRDVPPSLASVCGDRLDQVFQGGLSALGAAQVRALVANPTLLLELQERVLVEGGDYWSQLPADPRAVQAARDQWPAIAQASGAGAEAGPGPANGVQAARRDVPSAKPTRRRRAAALAAMAAVLLVAASIWILRPAEPTSGFDRPGLLTSALPAAQWRAAVARALEEDWFAERPTAATALQRRLGEMVRGCNSLLATDLTQLSAPEREALRERCRAWRGKFEEQRAALATGAKDLATVMREADALVVQMAAWLREGEPAG